MKKSIIDKEDFIRKSNIVHNEKYDYSKVDYVNTSTKVCITCLEHGDFFQTPYIHAIKGCGCPKCAKNKQSLAFSNNVDDIISKFREKHGELYDYRYVNEDYSNMHRKVRIICHKHGVFSQTPHNHLKGNGCPKCYMENKKNGNPKFLKNFIEKAEKIHNKKYKYDSEYFNSKSKVKIFCPIHGYFEQRVDVHLSGCGCPICANHFSKDELEIYEYVKSKINASYVSNLEDWIDTMPNIRLVLSGHVHCRKDLTIGKNNTRYIINACGYIPRNEPFKAPKFNPNLIIDTNNL